jgi:hypothetical protein
MRIFQMLLMLLKPTYKGNAMNKYSLSYNQIKARDEAAKVRSENRIGFIGAIILFSLYVTVSTMGYNDCINLGVC